MVSNLEEKYDNCVMWWGLPLWWLLWWTLHALYMANFATFVSKTLIFFLPKNGWIQFQTSSVLHLINYLNWLSPVFGWFQNRCNKVVIDPHVMQFWSEIILVISNWPRAARSCNFEIMHMISAQIALHLIQLPLFILVP